MLKKILIVEDESSIADTLIYTLEKEKFDPKWVTTIAKAKDLINRVTFSAIILDIGLPDGNGFDFCKEIRKVNNIPIIFLTARDEEIDKIVGLEIGADDYVTKPFIPREITARLKAIFRRTNNNFPTHNSVSFIIDEKKRQVHYKNKFLDLGRYEYGIISLLLKRPGYVYSRQQIMEDVWDCPDMSLERTVDTHIKTIRSKLKTIDPKCDDLITHRGVGYSIKE